MLTNIPLAAAMSVGTSAALTAAIVVVCRRAGWLVYPRRDRWHRKPVAQFGGVAILAAFVATTGAFGLLNHSWRIVALSSFAGVVGLVDDIWQLRPIMKLGLQFGLAVAAVSCGIVYPVRSESWINVAFSILWIVGITNAFNLLDNMDGLAAGVGAIACAVLVFVAPDQAVAAVIVALGGALVGFLIFNFNPAKVFMGDTGSLGLGFALSCLSIEALKHLSTLGSVLFVPVLVLFVPIFDTALVSITRRLNGRRISDGARDHTSHRLVLIGMSEREAVITLYILAALSGAVAIIWKRVWPDVGAGMLGLFLVAVILFWFYMANIQMPDAYLSGTNVFTVVIPELVRSVANKSARVLTDASLIILSAYLAVLLRFNHLNSQDASFFFNVALFAVVIKLPIFALFGLYRNEWGIASFDRVYPVFKGCALGSIVLVVSVVYTGMFAESYRSIFLVDFGLAFTLLTSTRLSNRIFGDLLASSDRKPSLLIGGPEVQFFRHYFSRVHREESRVRLKVMEIDGADNEGSSFLIEVANTIRPKVIGKIYFTPDCSVQVRECVMIMASDCGIPCAQFKFELGSLNGPKAGPEVGSSAFESQYGFVQVGKQ